MRLTSFAVGAVVILAIFCTGEVAGVTCPANYKDIHTKCLMFVLQNMAWESADVFCNESGGELARNLDNCPILEDMLWYIDGHKDMDNSHFWVGGTDLGVEGVWEWTNGDYISMSSLYWGQTSAAAEPNGGLDNNCLYLDYKDRHSFHDGACITEYRFICQANPIASGTTNNYR